MFDVWKVLFASVASHFHKAKEIRLCHFMDLLEAEWVDGIKDSKGWVHKAYYLYNWRFPPQTQPAAATELLV